MVNLIKVYSYNGECFNSNEWNKDEGNRGMEKNPIYDVKKSFTQIYITQKSILKFSLFIYAHAVGIHIQIYICMCMHEELLKECILLPVT